MSQLPSNIPTDIANALVAYFCHTINENQHNRLDEWICESDSNMRVFEECLETSLLPVRYDADRTEGLEPWQSVNFN